MLCRTKICGVTCWRCGLDRGHSRGCRLVHRMIGPRILSQAKMLWRSSLSRTGWRSQAADSVSNCVLCGCSATCKGASRTSRYTALDSTSKAMLSNLLTAGRPLSCWRCSWRRHRPLKVGEWLSHGFCRNTNSHGFCRNTNT